jgi:aspartate/methionine/tyrosine aminotransferase|tara:strand:- start:2905 stop:4095 length:1191 start_codon:yes stop_codon:yes gene_type:complete
MEISKLDKLIKPSGTMAISNKARELKAQGKPVIGFGAGEPDFPSPDYVVEAAKEAIQDPKNHKYSPVAGLASLRSEIARTTLEYSGFEVDPNNILVSNGGKQAIITCLMAILNPTDEVIIPAPYWTTYPEAVKIAGGNPVFIKSSKEQDFKIDVAMLEEAKTDKTKLLIWCSPSNPTGVVYSKDEANAIYQWVFDNNIWIMSDELYEHLVYEGVTTPSPAMIDKDLNNTLIINGVSKAYSMTGWRVGWLIANNEVLGLAKKIQSQATSNVSNISQLAAESALKNGLDVTKEMKIAFERRRNYAIKKIESIKNLSVVNGTGAFYLYVDVNFYCSGKFLKINSSEDLCNWLIENYFIAFVPGEVFGTNGFMRLSYALSDQELEDGLERLATAINDLNG